MGAALTERECMRTVRARTRGVRHKHCNCKFVAGTRVLVSPSELFLVARPPDRTLGLSLCGVCVVAMASIHAAKSPSARQRAIVLQSVLYAEMMWSQRTVARCAGWSGGVRAGAHAEWRSCLCSGRRAYSTQWRPRRRLWPHTVLAILPDLMPSTPHGTQQRCSVTPQVATLHTRTAWR